ncbi:hypothetical protein B0H16DRAFT_1481442 [Mycena metata]|uniref:Uncharacterized protein n=1 Tax=Mycena metata TaxID=1033252 RepID=A0AAD7MAB3_9AGAR|nr:hypothetical protein B0H16DRAFT_1481442 [Mycena metata]
MMEVASKRRAQTKLFTAESKTIDVFNFKENFGPSIALYQKSGSNRPRTVTLLLPLFQATEAPATSLVVTVTRQKRGNTTEGSVTVTVAPLQVRVRGSERTTAEGILNTSRFGKGWSARALICVRDQ